MSMRPINFKDIDWRNIADEFRNLNLRDIGAWPAYPRIAALSFIFVFVLVGGWWFFWSDELTKLDTEKQEEVRLRGEYLEKKRQSVNLDLYAEQLDEINRSFGALLKQLPSKAEIDSLLAEVNQAGIGRGLTFELFRPGQEQLKEFYAEVPVSIKLDGNYHDFGGFAEDIGKLSRIVTLNNISITRQEGKSGSQKSLSGVTFEATAKTFRYLDEDEIAKQKKAAKVAGGKNK